MAAAAPNANDDDDNCHQFPLLISPDDKFVITPALLPQGDAIYHDPLHLVHLVSAMTLSTNGEKHAPLPTAPIAAGDDQENIAAFLSKLDNLHHELMQLIHISSTSPSLTLANNAAPITNKHDHNSCNNDEHDNSDCKANEHNHNEYTNSNRSTSGCNNNECNTNNCHHSGHANKAHDDNDCGNTHYCARCMMGDLKDFYLGTPMPPTDYAYMRIPISAIPDAIMDHYKLHNLVHNGHVYVEIRKGMYGLPQV